MIKLEQKNMFEVIKSAVDKAVNFTKPTYGPASNKVIISKRTHKTICDDGVQIMRDLELPDHKENAVLNYIRETAIRTNDRAGDGTTGSLIMLQAIIEEVSRIPGFNGREIEKELKKGLDEAVKQLTDSAKPIKTKEDLLKVAMISFDDEKIAKIIADIWWKLGKDGVVDVGKSNTMETFAEISTGIRINRGYISPYMVTDMKRMEAVIEKPYILITDYRLLEVNDILKSMELLSTKKIFSLVVICDNLEENALATAIVNKVQSKFNLVAVSKPNGDDQTFLEDLATMTGGKFFSKAKGDKLEDISIEDFGRAEKFKSKETESFIIGPKGSEKTKAKVVADLRMAITSAETEVRKNDIKNRLARFTNNVATIKVGASTEHEVLALKYKVDDAVNAVQSAFKSGVVCGSGLGLARLKTSSKILNESLQAPFNQIKNSFGRDIPKDFDETKPDQALNIVTNKAGNFLDVGVLDPVDVLIAGIESAVSIASLLITTTGLIVEEPDKTGDQ